MSHVLWQNTNTGERGFWPMSGPSYAGGWNGLGNVPAEWEIAGMADFNFDGHADIVWQNSSTGSRGIWPMTATGYSGGWIDIGLVPIAWDIAGVADFTGDFEPDILWQNRNTGERGVWEMKRGAFTGQWISFGIIPLAWDIAAAGDFTNDGIPDILWQNTSTGSRGIWPMAESYSYGGGWHELGIVPVQWHIAAVGDLTGDNKPDIVWENTTTLVRGVWPMNGPVHTGGWHSFGEVPLAWRVGGVLAPSPCTNLAPHAFGTTTNGELSAADCLMDDLSFLDLYSVTLPSANAYLFTQSSSAFDTYLYLGHFVGAELSLIGVNDDANGTTLNSAIKALLPAGSFVLAANSLDDREIGSYSISSSTTTVAVTNCEEVWVVRGVETTQNLQTTDCLQQGGWYSDEYDVFIAPGDTLTLSMNSSALDAYLRLFDDDGSQVASNDDAASGTKNARIVYTSAEGGFYRIMATSFLAGATGAYVLIIQ